MTTKNTPNAAERPSDRAIVAAVFEHFARARASGADHIPGCTCDICEIVRRARELDSHRPAESVSAEPVAELEVTERQHGRFAKAYPTRYGLQTTIPVGRYPLYLHPQPSTFGAVSDEWSPTIDDMPEGICVAKRIHVERSRHMDNWFVGFGKDESCQIEGTANHWYWLAYALLGLVDEKDSPYSEDKPLPFSPAYIRAALESFAKRIAEAKERAERDDVVELQRIRDQAGAWEAVCVLMNELDPDWPTREGITGTDHMCSAIRRLAAPPAQAVSVPERRGIYVASRVHHADMWKRQRMFGVAINSTWIDEAGEGETGDFAELWARIESEIAKSTGLVLYAEQRDFPLKGALVEVGMALAHGVPVFAVLPHVELAGRTMRPVGSWLLDARVTRTDDLGHAIDLAAAPAATTREGKE